MHKLIQAYRLFLPHRAQQLLDSLPPKILETDWLRLYSSDEHQGCIH